MKVEATGIYEVFKRTFPASHLRLWRREMRRVWPTYRGSATKFERHFWRIRQDILVKHPWMVKKNFDPLKAIYVGGLRDVIDYELANGVRNDSVL